ncbi:hypothetical protein ACHAXR_011019, partial [Thalassiosira sp. AJA248-18]
MMGSRQSRADLKNRCCDTTTCQNKDKRTRDLMPLDGWKQIENNEDTFVIYVISGWRKGKLEIRTNIDGNTVVQGLVSIPIKSFEDAVSIWHESIAECGHAPTASSSPSTN